MQYVCTGYRLIPSISITFMQGVSTEQYHQPPLLGCRHGVYSQEARGKTVEEEAKFTTSRQEKLNSKSTRIFQLCLKILCFVPTKRFVYSDFFVPVPLKEFHLILDNLWDYPVTFQRVNWDFTQIHSQFHSLYYL